MVTNVRYLYIKKKFSNNMQTIDLTTLSGQQQAAQFIYLGWYIVEFKSDSITLQNPSYA